MLTRSTTSPETLLLNVNDVSKLLCCSPRHVYRLCDGGLMPRPLKLGGLNRWPKAAIEKWLAEGAPAVRD
jgi:predicted DNA-binding transcriptional regulator AlpA